MNATQNPAGPRLATGVPGLDSLLGGGLLPGRTVLIKGTPGTGKTTLALQMLVNAALERNECGMLLTFEQAPEQLYADAAALGWPLQELVEQQRIGLIFVEPQQIIEAPGRQAHRLLVEISDWVDDHQATRIVIDSISHLAPVFLQQTARASFMDFMLQLKRMGLTPILTAEWVPELGLTGMDAFLVDTLLHVWQESSPEAPLPTGAPAGAAHGSGGRRLIEVVKARGTEHLRGAHPLELGPGGARVWPRSEPTAAVEIDTAGAPPVVLTPLLATGVRGLDELLGGGYQAGSVIMVAGLSGTLKTTLGLHFLMANPPSAPEPPETLRLLVTLTGEDALHLRQRAALLGDPAGLEVLEVIPGAEPLERLLARLEQRLAAVPAGVPRRVLIDDGNRLLMTEGEATRVRTALAWLLRRLRAAGATLMITQQLDRADSRNPLADIKGPELADTIIFLGLVEIESRLERVLSVLKHRGGPASGDLRALDCAGAGELRVRDRFVGLSGVLAGTPLGRRKAQIEEIFQPLYFIRDFLAMARDEGLEPERRQALLANLAGETDRLIALLGRHFDQPQPGAEGPGAGQAEGKR